MKKTAIVPLDGSLFSLQVLESVKELLPPDLYRLVLLRVEPDPTGMVAGPTKMTSAETSFPMYASHRDAHLAHHPIYASQEGESQTAAVRASLQKIVRHLKESGYEVELAVRFGDPAREIANYAESKPVDLVAMSTHGRSGLRRLLFGSVAAALMQRLSLPILLVRPFEKA